MPKYNQGFSIPIDWFKKNIQVEMRAKVRKKMECGILIPLYHELEWDSHPALQLLQSN
jgi:hypothetical protein